MKVREPVARPLDLVAVELLLSASQAFLVGVLLYLAVGIWDDRGVGFGPVAAILALLGLAIGGAWLYWLMGGVGWPLAAAALPAALFLGFVLVLGWSGTDLLRVSGAPLLLSLAAAVYGVVGGVFIDSPRRWRWDQRQRPRPGTPVPLVSPTTRALVARMPRSLPRRPVRSPRDPLVARIEQSRVPSEPPVAPRAPGHAIAVADDGSATVEAGAATDVARAGVSEAGARTDATGESAVTHPTSAGGDVSAPGRRTPARATTAVSTSGEERDGIELPTSIEPRAQRSPWAWAAPPSWTRDEEDEATSGGSSRRP